MTEFTRKYYEKRAQVMVKNLQSRHFDAYYCATKEEALEKAISLIPAGASVGWGGALSAQQIGLLDAINQGNYVALDRDKAANMQEREEIQRKCLLADWFITGANALSIDGQMVNIDGNGNRVAAIVYGPKQVLVIAGMNKVVDTLESAVIRARTVAAPMNKQRFPLQTPCEVTGTCADCKSDSCICNQILITRNSKPAGKIKVILVGEELGF
ncbi:MAG: lactate utilization protein [Oscillospiraceae bacterium]|nr:lactate utilization protein [Oscillospiraceae bacterium]